MAGFNFNKKFAKAVYDFSTDGGAQGDIELAITQTIPAGAIVTDIYINETTPMTVSGGTADFDIQVGSASQKLVTGLDLTTSLSGINKVFSASPALTDDNSDVVAAVQPVEVSTAGEIQLHNDTSASGTFTAGVLEIYVEYVQFS